MGCSPTLLLWWLEERPERGPGPDAEMGRAEAAAESDRIHTSSCGTF